MTQKDKWLQNCQAWYIEKAKPYAIKKGIKLPFGQPPISYIACMKWFKKAKSWHKNLALEIIVMVDEIPPPPEPPPKRPE